jgi:hypothetical protein
MLYIIYFQEIRGRNIDEIACDFLRKDTLAKSLREAVNQDRERQRAKDEHGLK